MWSRRRHTVQAVCSEWLRQLDSGLVLVTWVISNMPEAPYIDSPDICGICRVVCPLELLLQACTEEARDLGGTQQQSCDTGGKSFCNHAAGIRRVHNQTR